MGAVWLLWWRRTWRLRILWRCCVPHFYVVDATGRRWHFKRRRDVLPWPLRPLWFVGQFVEMT
jgi:hypothetical protein